MPTLLESLQQVGYGEGIKNALSEIASKKVQFAQYEKIEKDKNSLKEFVTAEVQPLLMKDAFSQEDYNKLNKSIATIATSGYDPTLWQPIVNSLNMVSDNLAQQYQFGRYKQHEIKKLFVNSLAEGTAKFNDLTAIGPDGKPTKLSSEQIRDQSNLSVDYSDATLNQAIGTQLKKGTKVTLYGQEYTIDVDQNMASTVDKMESYIAKQEVMTDRQLRVERKKQRGRLTFADDEFKKQIDLAIFKNNLNINKELRDAISQQMMLDKELLQAKQDAIDILTERDVIKTLGLGGMFKDKRTGAKELYDALYARESGKMTEEQSEIIKTAEKNNNVLLSKLIEEVINPSILENTYLIKEQIKKLAEQAQAFNDYQKNINSKASKQADTNTSLLKELLKIDFSKQPSK